MSPLIGGLTLSLGILGLDLALPLGAAGGVPYVAVVLMTLWARRPGLKVLYMSGYAGTTSEGGESIGSGDAFLGKPFTPHQLAQKVREVLDA